MLKEVLHYGGGLALLFIGILGETGMAAHWVTIGDPHGDIIAGAAVLGLGAKVDANANRIGAGLLAIPFALLALFGDGGGAYAADLKPVLVKAQARAAVNDCTVTDCSGAFVGANVAGMGTSIDVLGSGLNQSVFGGGGMIGAQAEYQLWNGKYFAAVGAMGDFGVNPNGPPVSQNKFLGLAYVKLGVGLSGVFAAPVGTGAGFGADLAGAFLSPYAIIGAVPFGHQGWATGAGAAFRLGALWELTLDYTRITYKSGVVDASVPGLPVLQNNADNIVRLGIQRKISN